MIVIITSSIAAVIVMLHVINLVSKFNHETWQGHKLHFAALAVSYAFLAGGAIAAVLRFPPSGAMLLLGVAGILLFDRRIRV